MGTFSEKQESMLDDRSEELNLIRLAVAGKGAAFERLVKRYESQVYNLAYRYFNNSEDARDASQEVFLRAFKAISGFQGRSTFKTWLYRITTNTCSTLASEKARAKRGLFQSVFEWFYQPSTVEPAEMAVEKEFQAELKKIVREKIAKLPDAYRMPVILKDIEGLSHDEIGSILALKEGTVKSRINRGRRLLQESLQPFYEKWRSQ